MILAKKVTSTLLKVYHANVYTGQRRSLLSRNSWVCLGLHVSTFLFVLFLIIIRFKNYLIKINKDLCLF